MQRRQFLHATTQGVIVSGLFSHAPFLLAQSRHTGITLDDIYLQHHIAQDHPESPMRYRAILDALSDASFFDKLHPLTPLKNIEPWIRTIHSQSHIDTIRKNSPIAHRVASHATAHVLAAVDTVCNGSLRNAFCPTRPPGHHAHNTGKEEGFCYYNHIAVAARYAQQKFSLKKIAIIDWDYHHGNATEDAFYDDPNILFCSSHDWQAYPGTGDPARTGAGAGKGYNINIHLPCGSGDAEYQQVYQEKILPAVDAFAPDLILISCGFDSRTNDLLGCHQVSDTGYQWLTNSLVSLANKHCQGRLVSVLEGGYNIEGSATAAVAHVQALIKA
jgi:acetoin utilization deacetylase AcuC-like enzyme